jgi:hypothetical protein
LNASLDLFYAFQTKPLPLLIFGRREHEGYDWLSFNVSWTPGSAHFAGLGTLLNPDLDPRLVEYLFSFQKHRDKI